MSWPRAAAGFCTLNARGAGGNFRLARLGGRAVHCRWHHNDAPAREMPLKLQLCAVAGLLPQCLLSHSTAPHASAPPLTPVAGYTAAHGDCGYPVCGTLLNKGAVSHKTMDDIAAVCNATAGCEGFNSNVRRNECKHSQSEHHYEQHAVLVAHVFPGLARLC